MQTEPLPPTIYEHKHGAYLTRYDPDLIARVMSVKRALGTYRDCEIADAMMAQRETGR